MKNILRNALILLLALSLLCGCTGGKPAETNDGPEPAGTEENPAAESPYPVKSVKIDGEDISAFHILYSEDDGPSVRTAAGDLQKYIELATGAKLDVTTDESVPGKRIAIAVTEEDTENYSYKSDENGVTISGGRTRGAMYGAYGFLENCLGIRFLASDTDYVIPSDGIELNALDYSFTQYFEFRDSLWYDYFNPVISSRRMINVDTGGRDLAEETGGAVRFAGNFVHTIASLAEMQEEGCNPCFCDEEVYQTVLKNVMARIEANPDAKIVSVSQMDKWDWCGCAECKKVLREEKSYMGAVLRFVNRIAEEVEKVNPDMLVLTLAYQDTERVPKITVPRDNVIIQFCTSDLCPNHLISDEICKKNAPMYKTISDWGKICQRIYIWDYNVNFYYYLLPYPNFDSLYENMKFYYENGVRGFFGEGNYQSKSGEFGDLRAYLTARLLQNPYMTEEEYDGEIDTFLKGYYGSAWEIVRRYLDFVMECRVPEGEFDLYSDFDVVFNTEMFKDKSAELAAWFDEAEKLADDDKILEHVTRLRLSADLMRFGAAYEEEMNSGDEARQAAMMENVRELTKRITDLDIRFSEFTYRHNNPAPEEVESGPFTW